MWSLNSVGVSIFQRKRVWKIALPLFNGPHLGVVDIISAQIPLARSQSYGPTEFLRGVGKYKSQQGNYFPEVLCTMEGKHKPLQDREKPLPWKGK